MQPRTLPSETITNLIPPLARFPYFAHADQWLFEADAVDYSRVNAWWLADAAFLVYGGSEFVREAFEASPLPNQGFQLDWLGSAEQNRGMVLQSEQAMVIVFRGTRFESHTLLDIAEFVLIHQDDLWTDSQFLPAACQAGGKVHEGFREAFLETQSRLDEVLSRRRSRQKLWLTGHSLGGALATLAAGHVQPQPVHGLYTYGCPRVGNQAFVAALPQQSHYRFVHRDDWVTTVPPELLGYVHGGVLRKLPGSGPRRFWADVASGTDLLIAALKSMASQLRVDVGQLPFKIYGLTDHAAVYYAIHLWNDLLVSNR